VNNGNVIASKKPRRSGVSKCYGMERECGDEETITMHVKLFCRCIIITQEYVSESVVMHVT
jgi:hypothetical protein